MKKQMEEKKKVMERKKKTKTETVVCFVFPFWCGGVGLLLLFVRACVRVCVRLCVRACVRACVC